MGATLARLAGRTLAARCRTAVHVGFIPIGNTVITCRGRAHVCGKVAYPAGTVCGRRTAIADKASRASCASAVRVGFIAIAHAVTA